VSTTVPYYEDFSEIKKKIWLKKNIHNHGNYYKIDELLLNVTGEKLNLKYFEKHITDRYLKEKK